MGEKLAFASAAVGPGEHQPAAEDQEDSLQGTAGAVQWAAVFEETRKWGEHDDVLAREEKNQATPNSARCAAHSMPRQQLGAQRLFLSDPDRW